MRRCTRAPKDPFSLDLHVLSTPPAFVLSQNQTLQLNLDAVHEGRRYFETRLQSLRTEGAHSITRVLHCDPLFSFQRAADTKIARIPVSFPAPGHRKYAISLSFYSQLRGLPKSVRRLLQKRPFPVNIHFTKKSRIFSRGSGTRAPRLFNHPYG